MKPLARVLHVAVAWVSSSSDTEEVTSEISVCPARLGLVA